MYIQNSPNFGYEPATMDIKNMVMFIEKDVEYYQLVIEYFKIEVKENRYYS